MVAAAAAEMSVSQGDASQDVWAVAPYRLAGSDSSVDRAMQAFINTTESELYDWMRTGCLGPVTIRVPPLGGRATLPFPAWLG